MSNLKKSTQCVCKILSSVSPSRVRYITPVIWKRACTSLTGTRGKSDHGAALIARHLIKMSDMTQIQPIVREQDCSVFRWFIRNLNLPNNPYKIGQDQVENEIRPNLHSSAVSDKHYGFFNTVVCQTIKTLPWRMGLCVFTFVMAFKTQDQNSLHVTEQELIGELGCTHSFINETTELWQPPHVAVQLQAWRKRKV